MNEGNDEEEDELNKLSNDVLPSPSQTDPGQPSAGSSSLPSNNINFHTINH